MARIDRLRNLRSGLQRTHANNCWPHLSCSLTNIVTMIYLYIDLLPLGSMFTVMLVFEGVRGREHVGGRVRGTTVHRGGGPPQVAHIYSPVIDK